MQRKLIMTVVTLLATVVVGGTTVSTAQARTASLQIAHKPFSKMSHRETVSVLKKQIRKDHSVIRFWHNNSETRIAHRWLYHIQVHWARTSLKVAGSNLRKLTQNSVMTGRGTVQQLICKVFGPACSMALRVAERESHFSIYAINGQYLGIFQMGSSERAKFATIGYSTAYEQIIAAHNYYLVSGWSPWSQTAY